MVEHHDKEQHTLRTGALRLGGDWVAAVTTVAPSSSVAFTLGALVVAAGLGSPLAVVLVGGVMLMIAVGYARLNRWRPHAGAPFEWVGKAVLPVIGYAIGLLAIVAMTVANVANINLAGTYLLGIISPTAKVNPALEWVVATLMMALVIWIIILGIKVSIRFQAAIIVFEYTVVIIFLVLALKAELIDHAPGTTGPSWNMFTLSHGHGLSGFLAAAVTCAWLYVGWETVLVLGEETQNPHVNPGRAAILGVLFVTFWYTLLIIVFQGVATQGNIITHTGDVLTYEAGLLVGATWGRLLSIAVLSAVLATTQGQLIGSSRVTFAMARDKMLPKYLREINIHGIPLAAGLTLGVLPPIALILYLSSTTIAGAMVDLINTSSLLYLTMYAVIAFACVWYYRKALRESLGNLLLAGVIPLLGGLFALAILVYGLSRSANAVRLPAIGILIAVIALAFLAKSITRAPYFSAPRERYDPSAPSEDDTAAVAAAAPEEE